MKYIIYQIYIDVLEWPEREINNASMNPKLSTINENSINVSRKTSTATKESQSTQSDQPTQTNQSHRSNSDSLILNIDECKHGIHCNLVKTGKCNLFHHECEHGVRCDDLVKRNCGYYHPPTHFQLTEKHYQQYLRGIDSANDSITRTSSTGTESNIS